MSLNKDAAFKFGCGRYLQEAGAVEKYLAVEAQRFGTKAFILCGENGFKAAHEKIEKALSGSSVAFTYRMFSSTCCHENAADLSEEIKAGGFDLIVGVGGGVLMDIAKLTAETCGCRVILIPTSSATCAAYTPLSVMYDRDTRATIGSWKLMKETDAVIADTEILVKQPLRLFSAGVMDSLAKKIEIEHRYFGVKPEDRVLGFEYAYQMACTISEELIESTDRVLQDMENGVISKDFERAVFNTIAVTGMVSGVSKSHNQSAVAHRFYEECRTFFYEETREFLHGELVALGLLVQLSFSGSDTGFMLKELKHMGLPVCLTDIHVPVSARELFADELCRSSAIEDTSPEMRRRIYDALAIISR